VEHPGAVLGVVGIAGHGLHQDRIWSAAYEAGRHAEPDLGIEWNDAVWRGLEESFVDWVHAPDLWRAIAGSPVPMQIIAAADDIRTDWPLRQLAATLPHGRFETVPGVPHDFWHTHPEIWRETVAAAVTRS
jgi:proline iminopeptidase